MMQPGRDLGGVVGPVRRVLGRREVGQGLMGIVAASALIACGGPKVAGKWQATTSTDAGLEIKSDGTFQGELPGSLRLQGKWVAKGNEVTFTLAEGPTSRVLGNLIGKIEGDTMMLSSTGIPGGAATLKRRTN